MSIQKRACKYTFMIGFLIAIGTDLAIAQDAPETGYFIDKKRLFQSEPKLPLAIKYDCELQKSGVLSCFFTHYHKSKTNKNQGICYSHRVSEPLNFLFQEKKSGSFDHWLIEIKRDTDFCDTVYREIIYPVFDADKGETITGWQYVITGRVAINPEEKSQYGEVCSTYDGLGAQEYFTYPDDGFLKEECDQLVEE